jgi:hypothetical protein
VGLGKDYKNSVARGFEVGDLIILRIEVPIPLKVKVPSGPFGPGRTLTPIGSKMAG